MQSLRKNHVDSLVFSPRLGGRGFTITELLVVIVIFVLMIGMAIPAFKSMIDSSEKSLAENQLRVGLASARDTAIQYPSGDAAAVFFFTPGGKISIVPCVSVGFLMDEVRNNGDVVTDPSTGQPKMDRREVFVPVATGATIQMPRGWSVRGYTPANTISSSDPSNTGQIQGWYDSLSGGATPPASDPASQGYWVFPETGFYNTSGSAATVGTTGWQRQTFMVRFKSGTGSLDTGNRSLALVVDPVAALNFRTIAPWDAEKYRLDQAPNLASAVRRILAATGLNAAQQAERRKVLGDQAIDTVLARPVTELAIYNERSLAAALATNFSARGLNRDTGTIYKNPSPAAPTPPPQFGPELDDVLFPNGQNFETVTGAIGAWIEGNMRGGSPANFIESDARIYTLQQYLGQMIELTEAAQ